MLIRAMSDAAIGETIGQRLQEIRLRKNLSFSDLSVETGISRQTLHSLLNQCKGTFVVV